MRDKNVGLFVLAGVMAMAVAGCGSEPKEEVSVIDENHFDQLASTTDAPGNAAAGIEIMADGALPPAQPMALVDIANLPAGADMAAVAPAVPPAQQVSVKSSASYEEKVQAALKNAGYYSGPVDGKIGSMTREAIKSFQTANGLKADGVVGPGTWERLKKHTGTSQS